MLWPNSSRKDLVYVFVINQADISQIDTNQRDGMEFSSSWGILVRHSQSQPLHLPLAFPLRWQLVRHVDSAAQRVNCDGETVSSEHSQLLFLHSPSLLPMAWQVPLHNFSPPSPPKLHLEGKSFLNTSKFRGCSLHQHLLSLSQVPSLCPRTLQPSEQAESPKKHLNPASETYVKLKAKMIMANCLILMI